MKPELITYIYTYIYIILKFSRQDFNMISPSQCNVMFKGDIYVYCINYETMCERTPIVDSVSFLNRRHWPFSDGAWDPKRPDPNCCCRIHRETEKLPKS